MSDTATMDDREPLLSGWIYFAAIMMMVAGTLDILYGVAAIAKSEFFVVGEEYLYKFDITAWGWIHLFLGFFVLCAGAALFRNATWARAVGIIMAAVSLVGNFMSIPVQPVWSIVLVTINIIVIAALATSNDGVRAR